MKRGRWAAVAVMSVMSAMGASGAAAQGNVATMYLTTADRRLLLAAQPEMRAGAPEAGGPTITIDPTQRLQTMDGFGFAMTGGSAELLMRMSAAARTATLQRLFGSGENGIRTSYLRLTIGASDMNERVFTYDDVPAGEQDVRLAHFGLGPDLKDVVPVMQEVLRINPRIKILASPWTPPDWMKTNGRPKGGSLRPEFRPVYAHYFVRYLQAMRAKGIPIDAITVQNEPESDRNTPSLLMTAAEQAEFIKGALGPALERAGLRTKIVVFDHNCDHPEYPMAVLGDAAAARYVDGSGFHLYLGTIDAMTTVHEAFPAKNIYFTEQMTVEDARPGVLKPIAEPVSHVVIAAARNWSRNALLWNLAADPKFGPHTEDGGCPVCQGAITIDGDAVTENIAFYAVGQVSRFVPPGSVRVGSNELAGVSDVAFARPDGRLAVVVTNDGDAERHFGVKVGERALPVSLPGHAVATIVW